jgi:hypothetical protein
LHFEHEFASSSLVGVVEGAHDLELASEYLFFDGFHFLLQGGLFLDSLL